ncbi:hypothetical protein [Sulfuricystis multivorans]|uniref:hypothetical protein n=1 Tax=Sulfuricystis multivorans TaxID=2211108 RepID=UPI000F82CCE0|nr:hypothetical protein [Sulfuricystis multivorans]
MKKAAWLAALATLAAATVQAQISISAGGQDVRVGADGSVSVQGTGGDVRVGAGSQVSVGSHNEVGSSTGSIAPGANIEGVTIINGKLWIDGKEIPPGVKTYKSPKTGKIYKIERNGKNIAVTSND